MADSDVNAETAKEPGDICRSIREKLDSPELSELFGDKNGERRALFKALRPFVDDERKKRIDAMITVLDVIDGIKAAESAAKRGG